VKPVTLPRPARLLGTLLVAGTEALPRPDEVRRADPDPEVRRLAAVAFDRIDDA
jgi:hypothetical protein